MSKYTVYTAASDHRADQLNCFLEYFSGTNPDQTLKVILFDRDSPKVIRLCNQKNISIVHPSPIIDRCAKSIFLNREYRPGVESWKYMRKLNCFLDAKNAFIFLDLNCIPLASLNPLMDAYKDNKKDILFTTQSHANRTIRVETKQFLTIVDSGIREGYNCSIIASENNILDESIFKSFKGKNLRKMIAKAPEQGYLAIVMALSNISHGLFKDSDNFKSNYACGNNQMLNKIVLDFDRSTENIIIKNDKQHKTLITYKSTGNKLTDLTPERLKIFEKIKTKSKILSSALSKSEKKIDPITKNKLIISNRITDSKPEDTKNIDSQYTLKLYAPFRSGSNLVKAALEYNFENIHVLNNGDKHWKHAFHVQSKNYFGYIYCIRHPLNLAYSIRDYYYNVGRNIHSFGTKESFFREPISIYDAGIHQGRSPILFPNPVSLINAWYFNYLNALNNNKKRSTKILYEHMMQNQKIAIEEIIQSMRLFTKNINFTSINAKTKNLGDRRFNAETDLQGKIFDETTTKQRHKCGISDTNLIKSANNEDIDFILKEIDWSTSNQLGYEEDGIIKSCL